MILRRLVAVFALFAAVFTVVEPVLGELRDGDIHAEDVIIVADQGAHALAALAHSPRDLAGHSHEGSHQHGTNTDHCTHQHGLSFPAHADFILDDARAVPVTPDVPLFTSRISSHSFHPPRA